MTFLIVCTLQITVLLFIALLAQPLLRKKSAAARHLALSAAIVFAAVVPLLNLVMPSWHVPVAITSHPAIAPLQLQMFTTPPAATIAEKSDTASAVGAVYDRPMERSTPAIPRWLPAAVWSGGALIGVVFLLTGLMRLVRVAGASSVIEGGPWVELAGQISNEYRLRRPVDLLISLNSSILITFGVVRPKVILPAGAAEWPEDRARIVLRHELAHVRRGDWFVQMIAQCLRIVYWFNPLVWIVWSRLRLESECACDDAAVAEGSEGHEYATHLLQLARTLNRTDRAWSAAMSMSRPSTIERRFSAMLNPTLDRRPVTHLIMFATILAGLAVTLPLTMVSTEGAVIEGPLAEAVTPPAPQPAPRIESQQRQQEVGVYEKFQNALQSLKAVSVRPRDRALYEAAEQGDLGEIDDLLRAGANVNAVILGDGSPLLGAARRGNLNIVTALLDRDADPNVAVPGDGSALIAAAAGGRLDIRRDASGSRCRSQHACPRRRKSPHRSGRTRTRRCGQPASESGGEHRTDRPGRRERLDHGKR